jgi:cysteine desulfurase
MRAIYLDHSATTPLDPRVLETMLPYFTQIYGNASSAHSIGRKAENAIEEAREVVASVLNCDASEIIFTSGGSESDNLAIRGAAWAAFERGKGNHLITTPIEHGAVGKTVEQLAALQGFRRTILPVDSNGVVSVNDFAAAITLDTTVASVMYANNEIGSIQPIANLAQITRDRGVLFHTDAVQAGGQLSLDVQQLGVDLLSLSGHKFYGPKGVGVLYVRKGVEITPSATGGSHEYGLRPGTHNTPLIVGFAKALELAYQERESRITHCTTLRDQLISGILSQIPNARLTGHPTERLVSHASFVFDGIPGGTLLDALDDKSIAASAASACKTGSAAPSSVLLAIGCDPDLATTSLRLTVGLSTTADDIDYTVETLTTLVKQLSLDTVVA